MGWAGGSGSGERVRAGAAECGWCGGLNVNLLSHRARATLRTDKHLTKDTAEAVVSLMSICRAESEVGDKRLSVT